jgi:hypothetical protein
MISQTPRKGPDGMLDSYLPLLILLGLSVVNAVFMVVLSTL